MKWTLDTIYAEARYCGPELACAGCGDNADALETALCGATSGEVLTDLA